jgi:ribosome maturation factor RimP
LSSTDIKSIVERHFEEEGLTDCFYVAHKVNGNKIEVFIDSDTGVNYSICAKLSRKIEEVLDSTLEFGEKYTLDVSSPGVGSPLVSTRQYRKNIGRQIKVKFEHGKVEGTLKDVRDDGITVFSIEKVKEGKKNKKIEVNRDIMYSDIKEACIKISFK